MDKNIQLLEDIKRIKVKQETQKYTKKWRINHNKKDVKIKLKMFNKDKLRKMRNADYIPYWIKYFKGMCQLNKNKPINHRILYKEIAYLKNKSQTPEKLKHLLDLLSYDMPFCIFTNLLHILTYFGKNTFNTTLLTNALLHLYNESPVQSSKYLYYYFQSRDLEYFNKYQYGTGFSNLQFQEVYNILELFQFLEFDDSKEILIEPVYVSIKVQIFCQRNTLEENFK